MGKVADWREANWGRGRDRKATMPETKVWDSQLVRLELVLYRNTW